MRKCLECKKGMKKAHNSRKRCIPCARKVRNRLVIANKKKHNSDPKKDEASIRMAWL